VETNDRKVAGLQASQMTGVSAAAGCLRCPEFVPVKAGSD